MLKLQPRAAAAVHGCQTQLMPATATSRIACSCLAYKRVCTEVPSHACPHALTCMQTLASVCLPSEKHDCDGTVMPAVGKLSGAKSQSAVGQQRRQDRLQEEIDKCAKTGGPTMFCNTCKHERPEMWFYTATQCKVCKTKKIYVFIEPVGTSATVCHAMTQQILQKTCMQVTAASQSIFLYISILGTVTCRLLRCQMWHQWP